jgi:hypothetical protein
MQNTGPGATRVVAFIGVNLGIDRQHEIHPPTLPMSLRQGMSRTV